MWKRFQHWRRWRKIRTLSKKMFGSVLTPPGYCPACGYPIDEGQSVTGAVTGLYHELCYREGF